MSINDNLLDVAYVAIGFGVIGFQRAQVRRKELRKRLDEARKQADARVSPVVDALRSRISSA